MDKHQLQKLAELISMATPRARFVSMGKEDYTDADAYFETPNGAEFYIRFDSHAKRLHVNGSYNGLWKFRNSYNNPAPTISASPDRTPAQIARDIERRFLPAFLEDYAKAQASKTAYFGAIDRTYANAQQIQAASGDYFHRSERERDNLPDKPDIELHSYGMRIYGKARICDGNVDMALDNLTAGEAAQIVALIVLLNKASQAQAQPSE